MINLVAELSINHEGKWDKLEELIRIAHNSGFDYVKFQHYRTDDFIGDRNYHPVYNRDFFIRHEMDDELFSCGVSLCNQLGIKWFATPTQSTLHGVAKHKPSALKVGSDMSRDKGFINNVYEMAKELNIPFIVSLGMCDSFETEEILMDYPAGTIFFHCTSQYPTELENLQMGRLSAMIEHEDVLDARRDPELFGYSDHSRSGELLAATMAATLGARWIERHISLDYNSPDYAYSCVGENEARVYVENVRLTEKAYGLKSIRPSKAEIEERRKWMRE